MNRQDFAAALQDLMNQYDHHRARWIAQRGTADGFDAWFTQQVYRTTG